MHGGLTENLMCQGEIPGQQDVEAQHGSCSSKYTHKPDIIFVATSVASALKGGTDGAQTPALLVRLNLDIQLQVSLGILLKIDPWNSFFEELKLTEQQKIYRQNQSATNSSKELLERH